MKTLLKFLFLFCTILYTMNVVGQDSCKFEGFYTTDSVGNSNFKLPQKFVHRISEDSVRIYLLDQVSIPMMDFRITKKNCYKESDSTSYTIELSLHLEKKGKLFEPDFKIRFNYKGAYQLELLYPDKEPRIFYIDQQKSFFKKD